MCTHNDSVNLKESTAFKLGSSIPDDGESDDETKGESKLAIMQIRMRPRTNLLPKSAQVGTWKTVHQERSRYWPSVEVGHVDGIVAYNESGQDETQPDIGAIMGSTDDLESA